MTASLFSAIVPVLGSPFARRKRRRSLGSGIAAGVVATAIALVVASPLAAKEAVVSISGERSVWSIVTLDLDAGVEFAENGTPNPFTDVRAYVSFESDGESIAVPAYFAADGDAAQSGAEQGSIWRAHFVPTHAGPWNWTVSFRTGDMLAVRDEPTIGAAGALDGKKGVVEIAENPKARGLIQYVGDRYLRDVATGEAWLKAGADSPENLLAYIDFDGMEAVDAEVRKRNNRAAGIHRYEPHVRDFREGDATWRDGKGKALLGALNYLAEQGVNSVYFLTNNLHGDGNDAFPYVDKSQRARFDCSRLAQWEQVFCHMDRLGISLHVILSETENEGMFEQETGDADFAWTRKLYYREMIARFAHHRGVVWNLGEENGPHGREEKPGNGVGRSTTDAQRIAWGSYIKRVDPWKRPVVVHTYPGMYDAIYEPLLGSESLDGASLQMGNMKKTHDETKKWIARSSAAGRPWVVNLDEIGPADVGVVPDAVDAAHDDVRREALWGNLLAGGGGAEWYFGYKHVHDDLRLENFRSREAMFRQTAAALAIMRTIPFDRMSSHDELVRSKNAWCLANPGNAYLVYVRAGDRVSLDVPAGEYVVTAFDPLTGKSVGEDNRTVESKGGVASLTLASESQDRAFTVVRREK